MSSISRVFLVSNSAVIRCPLATSTYKISTLSKIKSSQKLSSNDAYNPSKMRNVRGCVPKEDHQLTQNFTKKLLLMNKNVELQKCELNCIGI
jgi:hypothetical protein